jgi:hypothetical protein
MGIIGWLAALAEVAVLLLICYLLIRPSSRAGGLSRRWETPGRWDLPEGSP